jgi:hypothetical protein
VVITARVVISTIRPAIEFFVIDLYLKLSGGLEQQFSILLHQESYLGLQCRHLVASCVILGRDMLRWILLTA